MSLQPTFVNYSYLAANGDFLVKDGAGTLISIFVGDKNIDLSGSVTVYDSLSASGDIIAKFGTIRLGGATMFDFQGLQFMKGLFVKQQGLTNSCPLTVIYY